MLQGLPLGGLDLFGNRLFFFRLFVGLSCYLTLHPTGAGGKLLRGDILFRHIAAKVGIKPGQPPLFRDMVGVLPFAYHLGLGIHLPPDVQTKKALKEAKGIGEAYALASSADKNYSYIPKGYEIPTDIDYFHITTNNTIYGTEIKEDIDCPVPLIADMSSDIMSRPVDVSKYDLIYGGAQKNVGPAGVIFAIIRKDSLGRVSRYLPAMLDYRNHIEKLSMYNTPPVFSIFMMNETLKWLKSIGGVPAIQKINQRKADLLYSEIDRNPLFVGTAAKEDRSLMNVCFVMAPGYEALQDEFLAFAKERGMIGIKGHRSVGGFRASLYNACTVEDVQALVDCMKEFEELKK